MEDGRRRIAVGPFATTGVLALAAAVVTRSRKLAVLAAGAFALDRLPSARRLDERLLARLERRARAAAEEAERRAGG